MVKKEVKGSFMALIVSKKDDTQYEEFSKEFNNIDQRYRDLVEKADKENQDFFINNSTMEHAKYLTFLLLKRARKSIKIFSNNFSELYYNNHIIKEVLKNKLDEGKELNVVFEENGTSNEMKELLKNYKKQVKLSILKEKSPIDNHFLLIDNTSFRIEYPHTKKDTKEDTFNVFGKVNFNNKELGNHINSIFNDLSKISNPISLS
ncbi:MAG: hypothetical protein AABW56_02110 [Nanoarchaeota archaeon]